MSARILIVDDNHEQLHLLEACLMAQNYHVLTATSGEGALEICQRGQCDLILMQMFEDESQALEDEHKTSPKMPLQFKPKNQAKMDAIEICVRLKFQQETSHIPLVMVTRHDDYTRRAQGVAAGVDDFIYYPVDGLELGARLNSLVNLKRVMDEVSIFSGDLGDEPNLLRKNCSNILLAGAPSAEQSRVAEQLALFHHVKIEHNPEYLLPTLRESDYDVLLLSNDYYDARYESDAVHAITQLRALNGTKGLAILMLAYHHEGAGVTRALSAGADDYLMLPIDRSILSARIHTQVLLKTMRKRLSQNLEAQLRQQVMVKN